MILSRLFHLISVTFNTKMSDRSKIIYLWCAPLLAVLLHSPVHADEEKKCYSVEECAASIYQSITRNWTIPTEAKAGAKVSIKVHLNRDGEVVEHLILESSGLKVFDDSCVKAIQLAAPFSQISDVSEELFVNDLETIIFNFKPELNGQ